MRLLNALIHALTEPHFANEVKALDDQHHKYKQAPFLLRFIIVIPDWDLVKHIGHYKFGISLITGKILHWLISEMNKVVEIRCDDLIRSKEGSAVASEPKFVWVKMINRVGCHDRALSVRHKFNTILEDTLTEFKNHYIMDISRKMNEASFFINEVVNQDGVQ